MTKAVTIDTKGLRDFVLSGGTFTIEQWALMSEGERDACVNARAMLAEQDAECLVSRLSIAMAEVGEWLKLERMTAKAEEAIK